MVVAAGADALCGALRVVGRGGLRGCVLGEGRFEWAIVKKACVDIRVVPRGLEPRTLRLLALRSNQLSYETIEATRLFQTSS